MKSLVSNSLHRLQSTFQSLSPARAQTALDFLEYLKNKDDEWDATAEILADTSLVREIKLARADLKKNGFKSLTSWRKIQRYV